MATQWERVKWLPSPTDARLLVDGFAYASPRCRHYVLTHFHSDHTVGLSRHFTHGVIYTTEVTARLLVHDMGLPAARVRPLALHTPFEVEGCLLTLLDANHCPGAAMVLVEVVDDSQGRRLQPPYATILHTGDCRWAEWMAGQVPRGLRIGTLYLDTTYANARYTFPPQAAVVNALVEWGRCALAVERSTLLVVGAYHIGKERLFLGLARGLGVKVWCSVAKRRVLSLLGLPPEDMALLVDDPRDAQVHVVGMGLRPAALEERYLDITTVCMPASNMTAATGSACPADASADQPLCAARLARDEGRWEVGVDNRVKVDLEASAWHSGRSDGGGKDGTEEEDEEEQEEEEGQEAAAGGITGASEGSVGHKAAGTIMLTRSERVVVDAEEEAVEAAAAGAVRGQWHRVVGVRATGWTFRKRAKSMLSVWTPKGWCTTSHGPQRPQMQQQQPAACAMKKPAAGLPEQRSEHQHDGAGAGTTSNTGLGNRGRTAAMADQTAGTVPDAQRQGSGKSRFHASGSSGGIRQRADGWRVLTNRVALVSAPYSEHSSFEELCMCVGALRPHTLIPTVNADTPAAARALVDKFAHLMDLSRNKSRIDAYLRQPPRVPASLVPHAHSAPAALSTAAAAGAAASCAARTPCVMEVIELEDSEDEEDACASKLDAQNQVQQQETTNHSAPAQVEGQVARQAGAPVAGLAQAPAVSVQADQDRDPVDVEAVDLLEQARIWELIQAQHARAARVAGVAAADRHDGAPQFRSTKRQRQTEAGPGLGQVGAGAFGSRVGGSGASATGQASIRAFFSPNPASGS